MSKQGWIDGSATDARARPLGRRAEVLIGGALLTLVVAGAVVASGQLEVPGTTELSAPRVALFAVISGVVAVAVAVQGAHLRRR